MELQAKDISFRYGKNQPYILEHMNLSVKSGERVGLFAPSGYGKSTLAKILAGICKPTSGEVLLDCSPIPQKGVYPVQLIYQHPEQAINPRWHLHQVLEESGPVQQELLDALGIQKPWLNRYPRQLSGGELQRFSIARALMSGAPFLICDEISTMLDVITQAQIWDALIKFSEKNHVGLLAVTHNMELARRVCTRVCDLSAAHDWEVQP